MKGKGSPGAGAMKESPREFVNDTRKIFYTEKSIIAKKEETEKLKEYVVMEHERLSEAIRIFKDDEARFEKYVNEQELDFANTKQKAEKAYDRRLQIALEVRQLQDDIEKVEIEMRSYDEKIEDFKLAKDFVELVITENKTLSQDIKNLLH
jgi:chromosome segregation ATPase